MKAHNLRIPKLSLLVPLAASKPELQAFKEKNPVFLGHRVGWGQDEGHVNPGLAETFTRTDNQNQIGVDIPDIMK